MAQEIERKFLLVEGASIPIPAKYKNFYIKQGYIHGDKDKNVRIRLTIDKAILGIIVCSIVIAIGYYILNHIATLEDPPLGNTLYILLGLTLIAAGGIGILIILKHFYENLKKKRRREIKRKKHKVVFLKKDKNKK